MFERSGGDAKDKVIVEIGDGFKSFPWCFDWVMGIGFTNLSLGADFVDCKVAGTVEV